MSLLKKTNRSDIRNDFYKRAGRVWHGLPRERWGHCPQRCFRSVEIWPWWCRGGVGLDLATFSNLIDSMFYDGTSEVALGVWARETGSVDQPWFAQVLTPGQLLGCSWLCHSSVPRTGASSLLPTFWLLPISCPGPSSWCPVFVDFVSHSKLLISMSCVPAAHQELVLGGTASSKTNPGLLEHQPLWATFLSWRALCPWETSGCGSVWMTRTTKLNVFVQVHTCICELFICHSVSFSALFYSQPGIEKPTPQGRACSSHQEVGMHKPHIEGSSFKVSEVGMEKNLTVGLAVWAKIGTDVEEDLSSSFLAFRTFNMHSRRQWDFCLLTSMGIDQAFTCIWFSNVISQDK